MRRPRRAAGDVFVYPFGQDAPVAAVFERADLPGNDEKLGRGKAIVKLLGDLSHAVPLGRESRTCPQIV
jgi:hypothetical protein